MDITKDNSNEVDMTKDDSDLWLEDAPLLDSSQIQVSTRIGINGYGSDSANKPYRFYEKGNVSVSVFDKDDDSSPKKKKLKRNLGSQETVDK